MKQSLLVSHIDFRVCVCVYVICFMVHLKIEHFSFEGTHTQSQIHIRDKNGGTAYKTDFTIMYVHNLFILFPHFTNLLYLLINTQGKWFSFCVWFGVGCCCCCLMCVCMFNIRVYVIFLLASTPHASRSAVHTLKPNKSSKRTKATETA